MSRVLLIGIANPSRLALEPAVRAMAADGADVQLVVVRDLPAVRRGLPLAAVHVIGRKSALPLEESATPAQVLWWKVQRAFYVRLIRRVAQRCRPTLRAWLLLRFDPWVRAAAREADVIVALDVYAVYSVRYFGKRRPESALVHGLDAAVRAVTGGDAVPARVASPASE